MTFIGGLIIAIVASSIISTFIAMQIPGPKGDKGDTGPQGAEGPQGEQGPQGSTVEFAQWSVSWKTITGDLEWGAEVKTSTFSSTFNYDWGLGTIILGYDDYIGFYATMQIRMQRDGPVSFTIGSDDGSKLYIDGDLKIDNWGTHTYQTKTIVINLSQGTHTIGLWYYDLTGYARISFDCDSDILMWHGD